MSLSVILYAQVIFWEPKSFPSTEPQSLSVLAPGAPLASPPCPDGSQLSLRQGAGQNGEGTGLIFALIIHKGCLFLLQQLQGLFSLPFL